MVVAAEITEYVSQAEIERNFTIPEAVVEGHMPMVAAAVSGPYTDISRISATSMSIILSSIENNKGKTYSLVNYSGKECYKFTSGANTIYVYAGAFQKEKSLSAYPSASSVSTTLTNHANNKDTDYIYSNLTKSEMAADASCFIWDIAQVGVQAYKTNNDYCNLQAMMAHTIRILAYDSYLYVAGGNPSIKVQPTLTFTMKNTGNKSAYFGAVRYWGLGENTSNLSIQNLVSLGSLTKAAVGAVTGLTISSLWNLLNTAVTFSKQSASGQKLYVTPDIVLSNPGKNIYVYKCGMKAPFTLKEKDSYYKMDVGIIGYPSNATTYSCSINYGLT